MMRYTIPLLVALFIGNAVSQAAQNAEVFYSGNAGESNAVVSAGQPVPDGNTVEIGYFTSGFNPTNNANSLLTLGAAWHEFGSANISTFAPSGPPVGGRFLGDSITTDPSFQGNKIYLWIFETSGNGAPAADFSNVLEYGLYSSSSNNWVFPPIGTPGLGNQQILSSNQIDTFLFGDGITSGSGDPRTPGSLQLANVQAVPEPGVMALLGVSLFLGGLFHRRIRRENSASGGPESKGRPRGSPSCGPSPRTELR